MTNQDMGKPDRIICVLGMHRSGTSCLTGSLQDAGLYLGNCHTWNPHNLKGNRENQEFVDLHDAILAANDSAWDRPPRKIVWRTEDEQKAKTLLASYNKVPVLGFKDPRTLLLLDGWKRVYPGLQFVGIVRHPDAVAGSLLIRNAMPRDAALVLWCRYNRILYKEYRRDPFPILCFDDEEDVFHQKLDRVVAQMDLNGEVIEQRFYDSALKTNSFCQRRLPWRVRRLYGQCAAPFEIGGGRKVLQNSKRLSKSSREATEIAKKMMPNLSLRYCLFFSRIRILLHANPQQS